MDFLDSEDEVCLLASEEEEIDTGSSPTRRHGNATHHRSNNNHQSKLPSHLAMLDADPSPLSYGDPETHNGTVLSSPSKASSHRNRCCGNRGVFVLGVASLCAVGGVLFGYDVGIISGALLQVAEEFELTCFEKEVAVSSMLLGAILSSCIAGFLVDYLGRKRTIIVNSLVFVAGALVLALAVNFPMLVAGRVIVGFAVALSVVAECVYVSEISPPRRRGLLVSLNEVGITLGFLLAYVINYALMHVTFGWRLMFGLAALPALAQGIGTCFLPSSPRFLLTRQRELEARQVLERLYDGAKVEMELDKMKSAIAEEQSHSFLDLFRSKDNMRYRLYIGLSLVLLQQLSGQPTVLNYAPKVLQYAGYHRETAAVLATVGLGVAKVVFCGVAIALLDHVGRRKLMISGLVVMTICIIAFGFVSTALPQSNISACSLVDTTTQNNITLSTPSTTLNDISVTNPFSSTTTEKSTTHNSTTKPASTTVSIATPSVLATTSPNLPMPTTTIPRYLTSSITVHESTTSASLSNAAGEISTVQENGITSVIANEANEPTTVSESETEVTTAVIGVTSFSGAESHSTATLDSTAAALDNSDVSPRRDVTPLGTDIESESLSTTDFKLTTSAPPLENNNNEPASTPAQRRKRDIGETSHEGAESDEGAKSGEESREGAESEDVSDSREGAESEDVSDSREGAESEDVIDSSEGAESEDVSDRGEGAESKDVSDSMKYLAVLGLVLYVGGYELSFGAGTWLILSEIFPSAVRGRAIAMATVLNWGANMLVSLTFLNVLNAVGSAGTFIPYGVVCAVGVVFLVLFLPETKGRTLEEIGQELNTKSVSRTLGRCVCCKKVGGSYQQIQSPGDIMLDHRLELLESD